MSTHEFSLSQKLKYKIMEQHFYHEGLQRFLHRKEAVKRALAKRMGKDLSEVDYTLVTQAIGGWGVWKRLNALDYEGKGVVRIE